MRQLSHTDCLSKRNKTKQNYCMQINYVKIIHKRGKKERKEKNKMVLLEHRS